MNTVVEPDAEVMLAHCHHLFGDCVSGRIELAWTDAGDGRLRHAATFDVGELDELVTRALQENRTPGVNTYIGAALRRPDVPATGRCGDDAFLALPAAYCDLDLDGALEAARERYRHAGAPPRRRVSSPAGTRTSAVSCCGGSKNRSGIRNCAAG